MDIIEIGIIKITFFRRNFGAIVCSGVEKGEGVQCIRGPGQLYGPRAKLGLFYRK